MILDDNKQREMLLEIIDSAQYVGRVIDNVFYLKQAVRYAELLPHQQPEPNAPAVPPAAVGTGPSIT